MGFIDWINNRKASEPVAHETKPENAKKMYARLDAQERADLRPIDRLSPEQLAKVDAIKERLKHNALQMSGGDFTPSADGTNGNREAERQKMTAQDKTAPALSPTSTQAGKTAPENAPRKRPEKPPARPQTVPRTRPSWER